MTKRYTLGVVVGPEPTMFWMLDNGNKTDAAATPAAIKNISNNCEISRGWFYGGEFHGGTFNGGVYHGGEYYGGEFHGGAFYGGAFYAGALSDGEFYGTFYGGVYNGGVYKHVYRHWYTSYIAGGELIPILSCNDVNREIYPRE